MNWPWPLFVLDLKDTVGSFFSMDFMSLLPEPECASDVDSGAGAGATGQSLLLVLLINSFVSTCSRRECHHAAGVSSRYVNNSL
jgi:hypothetical protein